MNNLISALKQYFSQEDDVILAFLFGSYAKERQFEESDMDVAIWLKEGFNWERTEEIWDDLQKLIKKEIDVVVLNNAKPQIAWSALRGIPLKISDYDFYLKYMLRTSQEAEELQDFVLDFWQWRERIKHGAAK